MFRLLLLLFAVASALAQDPVSEKEILVPPRELSESEENAINAQKSKVRLEAVNAVIGTLKDAKSATIYEGLPHPHHQRALLKDEIGRKKNIEIQGFHFYLPAVELSQELRLEIFSILQDGSWLIPSPGATKEGERMCGGFHPDFQLEWKTEGRLIQIQFCLGCEEVKIFGGKETIYWYIHRNEKLRKWLYQFRKLCPKSRRPFFRDEESAAQQVTQLRSLLKQFARADAEIWEALPSPLWRDLRDAELKAKANVDIHGYLYYEPVRKMDARQRDAFFGVVNREGALRAATNEPVSTFPHGGYLIRVKSPEGELDLQVALERGEIHYYWNDDYGYAPLSKEALEETKKVLAEFQKQRPARGPVKTTTTDPQ